MLSEGRALKLNGGSLMVRARNKNASKVNPGTVRLFLVHKLWLLHRDRSARVSDTS
jgi:hypothetical protein